MAASAESHGQSSIGHKDITVIRQTHSGLLVGKETRKMFVCLAVLLFVDGAGCWGCLFIDFGRSAKLILGSWTPKILFLLLLEAVVPSPGSVGA